MLKKLISKVSSFFSTTDTGNNNKKGYAVGKHVVPRKNHGVSRSGISSNALKVLYRLKNSGFQAYIVGGGVRDLLLETVPKDFDVVTDARPWEIKKLFKNCRLIGKRFRLAHIHFGQDIIEVATFRGCSKKHNKDNEMLTRDNVYGSLDEDVWRRDFTVNALYYNIADFSILDKVGGIDDIKARRIRIIGEPNQRYIEDPVRMLRAIRFACKLGFDIERKTAKAIHDNAHLLADVPAARLLEEYKKLFLHGAALNTYNMLLEYGLIKYLIPIKSDIIKDDTHKLMFRKALEDTDARFAHAKPLNPAFLLAVFLWPNLQLELSKSRGHVPGPKLHRAVEITLQKQRNLLSLPKYFSQTISEIWELQYRLEKPAPKYATRTLSHPRFRAALDFLIIRDSVLKVENAMSQWWQKYLDANDKERWQVLQDLKPKRKRYNIRNYDKGA